MNQGCVKAKSLYSKGQLAVFAIFTDRDPRTNSNRVLAESDIDSISISCVVIDKFGGKIGHYEKIPLKV